MQTPSPARRPIAAAAALLVLPWLLGACAVRYGAPIPPGTPAQAVEWLDRDLYPFESQFLEVDGGILHYVDVGPRDATPIVLVHGTPTWSFLYRELIRGLAGEARVIAPDHIGFGLSAKPPRDAFGYTPRDHSANLVALIDHLDLHDATLVIHDLGGPAGIGAALERPERIARIVVINSFAWSLADDERVEDIDGLLHSRLGEWLYLDRNVSPEFLLPSAFGDDFELTPEVKRHYTHPFADPESRVGLLEIGRSLRGQSDWYAALWARRAELEPRVVLLVFGRDDTFFGREAFDHWREAFPFANAHGLRGVGHFPQEEDPEVLIRLLQTPLPRGAPTP